MNHVFLYYSKKTRQVQKHKKIKTHHQINVHYFIIVRHNVENECMPQ